MSCDVSKSKYKSDSVSLMGFWIKFWKRRKMKKNKEKWWKKWKVRNTFSYVKIKTTIPMKILILRTIQRLLKNNYNNVDKWSARIIMWRQDVLKFSRANVFYLYNEIKTAKW